MGIRHASRTASSRPPQTNWRSFFLVLYGDEGYDRRSLTCTFPRLPLLTIWGLNHPVY
jgi:hypothetical protein